MGHKKVSGKITTKQAARILADPKAGKNIKSLAGSVLAQARGKN